MPQIGLFKDEIDILYTASNKLTQATTSVEQLEAVSDYARHNGATIGLLFHLASEEDYSIEVAAEWFTGEVQPLGVGLRGTLSIATARPDRPTLIQNLQEDTDLTPKTRDFFEEHHIRAVAILPLNNKGRWVGALLFGWSSTYLFDERDLRIFTALQQQIAPVTDSTRLFEQAQKRAHELEIAKSEIDLLYAASNKLTRAKTSDELLEAISDYAREHGAVAGLLIYGYGRAKEELSYGELVAEWTLGNFPQWGTGTVFPASQYITNVWKKNPDQPLLIADSKNDTQFNERMRLNATNRGIASSVFLPLNNQGRWVGLVIFNWNTPYQFSEHDFRMYQSLQQQAAAVIDAVRLGMDSQERAARAEHLVKINTALSQATNELEILDSLATYATQSGIYGMILNYVDYDEETDSADSYGVALYKDGKASYFEESDFKSVYLKDYGIQELWIHQPDRVLFIENISSDSRISPENRDELQNKIASRAMALMPLYSGRGYKGILTIFWDKPHRFTDEEKYIYTALMQPISSIIASRRAYLAEEAAREESQFLYRMSEAINAATSFKEILRAVEELDPEANLITLTAWENDDYEKANYLELLAALQRGEARTMTIGQRFKKEDFPITDTMPHNGVWVIEDTLNDPRVDEVSADTWLALGTRAMLGTTLNLHNKWIGGLTFRSNNPRSYSKRTRRLMSNLKELVVAAYERIRLQAETEASRQQAEMLAQTNAALTLAKDETEILAAVMLLAECYGAAVASLAYARGNFGEAKTIEIVAAHSASEGKIPLNSLPARHLHLDHLPILGLAQQHPEIPIFVEDVFNDPRVEKARTLPQAEQWPAMIAIQLKTGDQWQGMLSVMWSEPKRFTHEIRTMFKAVQPIVSAIVATRRAYLAERQRAHELETVAKVSAAASGILDVQELLDTVVELGRKNFDRYHMFVYLLDEKTGNLIQETGVKEKPLIVKVDCKTSLISHAACARKGMIVNDIQRTPDYDLTPMLPMAQSEMAVPMVVGDELIGVLSIQSKQSNDFVDSDIWVMATLADLTAVAVQNARLYTQAQELAALEERNRLARELHDSVSQALYGIALGARTARTLLERNPAKLHEPLDYVLALAEGGLTEMRALIFELRPESLENEGLINALSKQAAALQVRHGLKVEVDLCNEPDIPLDVKETLYRIAREGLHNTIKHAQATHVILRIQRTETAVTLEVSDNGLGFEVMDSFPGHLGLQSMRERTLRLNGTIEVKSAPGKGTNIFVSIPIDPKLRTLTMNPVKL